MNKGKKHKYKSCHYVKVTKIDPYSVFPSYFFMEEPLAQKL